MDFENFEPIFGESKVDSTTQSSSPLPQFLLHAYASDYSHLVIHVTDFHSDTWEAQLSVSRLEDIVSILTNLLLIPVSALSSVLFFCWIFLRLCKILMI